MAAWVSVSDWNGNGSPFGANAHYVGLENYRHLLTEPGLDQNNFGTAIRNNLYYVIFVVPIQTAVALFLAVLVNRRAEGRRVLPDRVLLPVGHELGRDHGPLPLPLLADRRDQQAPVVLRRERAGVVLRPARPLPRHPRPVRRPAVDARSRTSSSSASATGTGCPARASRCASSSSWPCSRPRGRSCCSSSRRLQNIDESINEAAALDGASEWRKFRHITVPMIRPTLFTVVTLGLIGTWQIFDQIYVGTKGSPLNTTLDAGVPLVQRLVQQQQLGRRRRDRLHPLRDHRLLHARDAAPHPQPGPRAATAPLRPDAGRRRPGRVARRVGHAGSAP